MTKAEKIEDTEWVNIYAQYIYHSPATIRGTRNGLVALRDALTKAIDEGEATAVVFASDGEGYGIKCRRVNVLRQLGEPEYRYQDEFKAAQREAERAKTFKIAVGQ